MPDEQILPQYGRELPVNSDAAVALAEAEAGDGEQTAVLADLRTAWLADFEEAAKTPALARPTRTSRVRQRLARISAELSAARERRQQRRDDRAARQPEPAVRDVQPTQAPTRPRAVAPSGPVAPPVQEPALLELRDGWVADVTAHPEKHAPKQVRWYRTVYSDFEPIVEEVAFWVDCLKALAHREVTPREKRRTTFRGERARRAEAAGRALTAIVAVAFAIGLVVYVSIVVHILNPHQLARVMDR